MFRINYKTITFKGIFLNCPQQKIVLGATNDLEQRFSTVGSWKIFKRVMEFFFERFKNHFFNGPIKDLFS